MKIRDIKEALLGRRVRHYNAYTGTLDEFIITIVAEVVHAVCFYSPEKNSRIYMSKDNIPTLISEKYFCRILEVEGCNYKEEWAIID